MFGWRERRRRRLREQPLPAAWRAVVDGLPAYRALSADERRELDGLIQVFLNEKRFEGCGGLILTDEIRVGIAAQACMLLLGRPTDLYPTLRTVLVYPSSYVVRARRRDESGIVIEGDEVRLGESHLRDTVILAWDAVRQGASDIHDGNNVVFHEFAHQLDNESGATEGAPDLPRGSSRIAWARVLGGEYRTLVEALEAHRPTFLRPYAATNPAEFFAVATEYFFERPVELRTRHPELYGKLSEFYRRDPAAPNREDS